MVLLPWPIFGDSTKKHMILYNHIDPPVLVGSLGFTWLILDTPPLFGKKNESLQVAAGREA
jgi:hypothetical protein